MNLNKKILSSYLIMIAFMAIMGIQGFNSGRTILGEFQNINEGIIPMLGVIDEIKTNVVGQANDERGFLLTGEDSYVKEINDKAEAADKVIEKAMATADDDKVMPSR